MDAKKDNDAVTGEDDNVVQGYILLKYAPVFIYSKFLEYTQCGGWKLARPRLLTDSNTPPLYDGNEANDSSQTQTSSSSHVASNTHDNCPECRVYLQNADSFGKQRNKVVDVKFTAGTKSGYLGFINEQTCKTCLNKRSDASLVLGALIYNTELMVLRDVHFLLLSQQKEPSETANEIKTSVEARVSMVLTIDIPITKASYGRAGNTKDKRLLVNGRNNIGLMGHADQLICTLLKGDVNSVRKWMKIEEKMVHLGRQQRKIALNAISLFPNKISLEELYSRASSAQTKTAVVPHKLNNIFASSNAIDSSSHFHRLPNDVLLNTFVSYLRSRMLHSLRCSCTYLHFTLRAVVPGLKSPLKLYKHQIYSLSWMRSREWSNCNNFNKTNEFLKESNFIYLCTDKHDSLKDINNAALYSNRRGQIFCMNTLNGALKAQYMDKYDESYRSFSLLHPSSPRGGLLCDDPGLGKTITVLSLILQTWGQSTQSDSSNTNKSIKGSNDPFPNVSERIFNAYWKDLSPVSRRKDLSRIFVTLQRSAKYPFFDQPVDPVIDVCEDYFDIIQNPISFLEIRKRLTDDDGYGGDSINDSPFVKDLKCCFDNAMIYNGKDHIVHKVAQRLLHEMIDIISKLKEYQVEQIMERANSGKKRASYGDNVAKILGNGSYFAHSLVPSRSTLLIVPGVLINHWKVQIMTHINLKYLTSKEPIIYRHGKTKHSMSREEIMNSKESHAPLLFIDEGSTSDLPDPDFLALFPIVITSTQRITNAWKCGNLEDEMKSKSKTKYRDYSMDYHGDSNASASPLLKVHWLRMIVDEGHIMGRSAHGNAIQFASWITAQRNWIMSGTPTPQNSSSNGMRNILGLMKFLKHEYCNNFFDDESSWKRGISRAWSEGFTAAFFRLEALICPLMVRHTKSSIEELAQPKFSYNFIEMSNAETLAYNTISSAIRSNILITSMNGKTSGWQDSLLNSKQAVHASKALNNIRLSCCGGTRVNVTLTEKNWNETIDYLKNLHDVSEIGIKVVKNFLHRATTEQTSSCMVCGIQLQTLMLIPCRSAHLICTDCMNISTNSCPVCDIDFDVDDFQRLQPGFVNDWKWNLKEQSREAETRLRQQVNQIINPTRHVGIVVDESQIIQEQNRHNLLLPLGANRQLLQMNIPRRNLQQSRQEVAHQCVYPREFVDGKCEICFKEHTMCNLTNSKLQCNICQRPAEECPEEESKAYYLIQRLLDLKQRSKECAFKSIPSPTASIVTGEEILVKYARPVKVILFSQFRQILNVVGDRLIRRFGNDCIAEYWGGHRKIELAKFILSENCFCMLLGKDGSHGLDLSFVTHIFFVEEIWDKSLKDQVIARAYRMGATGSVHVEQLVAKNSVEEIMMEMNKTSRPPFRREDQSLKVSSKDRHEQYINSFQRTSSTAKEIGEKQTKQQFLLQNLKLIRTRGTEKNSDKICKKMSLRTETRENKPLPNKRVRFDLP